MRRVKLRILPQRQAEGVKGAGFLHTGPIGILQIPRHPRHNGPRHHQQQGKHNQQPILYRLLEPDLTWSLLLNLADNAQKAMERGGELQFQADMLEDGVRVQVLDTGRGIPAGPAAAGAAPPAPRSAPPAKPPPAEAPVP